MSEEAINIVVSIVGFFGAVYILFFRDAEKNETFLDRIFRLFILLPICGILYAILCVLSGVPLNISSAHFEP